MKKTKTLEETIADFAADPVRWTHIKAVLLEEIQVKSEDISASLNIIKLVDQKIREAEQKVIKLN